MPLLNRIRNSRMLNRNIAEKTNALKRALQNANSTYSPSNANKYSNVRRSAIAFIGSNGRVGTLTTYKNIINTLRRVKQKRQNERNNREKQQKAANRLKTLNNVENSNLQELGLVRRPKDIERRVASYQNRVPSRFATYPNMVQYLLYMKRKQEQERKNKLQNLINYKQQKRNSLTPNQQRIFNLIIGNTKPRNASIKSKWYSNYKNGYEGSYAHQMEPLRGKELINYKINVARRLHANPN
jgi:hypothetical protein